MCGVMGPRRCIEAVRFCCWRDVVSTYENDFSADGAEIWDVGAGVPSRGLRVDVVFLEDLREMFVRRTTDALALQRDQERFARMRGEEVVARLEYGREVFWARETDGKGAVHEVEVFLGWVGGVGGLESDVEEADAVLELDFEIDTLAADGGECTVVGV